MRINLRSLIIFTIVFFSQWQIKAQDHTPEPLNFKYNTWSIGINYGLLSSYGEIKQHAIMPITTYNSEIKGGFGLTIGKQFTPTVGTRFQTMFGTLSGSKRELNTYYRADLNEYSLNAIFSINNILCPNKKMCKFNLYALSGIGMFSFRSALRQLNDNKFLYGYGYNLKTGQSKNMVNEWFIPLGIGIKYKLDDDVDFGIESSLRFLSTDKLDAYDVKGTSADKYQYTSISVVYKFGKGRYQLEWLSTKQKNDINKFLIDSVYKAKNINDTLLSVYFDRNAYTISLENEVKLMKVIQYMNANPKASLEVIGYYDINGEPKYLAGNSNIATVRALAVIKLLSEKYNISVKRMKKQKVSDTMDYALSTVSNPTNRRVDIIVRTPKIK